MPRTLADATAGLTLGVNVKKSGKTLDKPGSFSAWERLILTLCRSYYDGTGTTQRLPWTIELESTIL